MLLHLAFLLVLATVPQGPQQIRIGEIDFFGTQGVDVQKVRSMLQVRRGDEISKIRAAKIRSGIDRAVDRAVGHPPTDEAFVCCDSHGDLMIYVGLGGQNTTEIPVNSVPAGSECLPSSAVALYGQAMASLATAVESGNSGEDDSRGYSLSNDPALRRKQMAMREYAIAHEPTLERALQACRRPKDRRAAAELLGYGRKSAAQIRALVRASRDPDEEVRNNAIRALWVLAVSGSKTASEIPADRFIEMLNSGAWLDRNKAGMLLMALTRSRDPRLLQRLRTEALPSLIEMARWHDPGHAVACRVILGRIAGLSEARIQQLIRNGSVDEIVAAAENASQVRKAPRQ